MLEHAVYAGEHSVLDQVMHMYRAESYYDENDPAGWHPGESLADYLVGREQPREVEYSRYWHGYLVVLKPLLLLTSVNSIRLLNSAIQLILVGICLILMTRKGDSGLAVAFVCAMPFFYYVSTYASLSQSICFYVMLLAVIGMLLWDDKWIRLNLYGIYFLVVGMLTSYFDFLTYPIVTLCFPLGVYLYLHAESKRKDLKKMVGFSLEWCVGYLWMWATKWIFADVLSDCSTVKDALGTILTRTQSADGYSRSAGFVKVLRWNLEPFMNWSYAFLGMLFLIALAVSVIRNRQQICWKSISDSIPFLCVALYPIVWWFITQNHSEQHWMFTCRIFAATVFLLGAGIAKTISREKNRI